VDAPDTGFQTGGKSPFEIGAIVKLIEATYTTSMSSLAKQALNLLPKLGQPNQEPGNQPLGCPP
jgi:hypothetical protein